MKKRILLLSTISLFTFCLLWSATGSKDLTSWTFTPIDVPGATSTRADDMNGSGQIVGVCDIPEKPYQTRGFILSDGVFRLIEIGDSNGARGINDAGEIVGWFFKSGDGYGGHAYSLRGGMVKQIDYPGAYYTIAEAINAKGDIVGYWGTPESTEEHGFLLRGGVYTTIDYPGRPAFTNLRGINDKGDIVGIYEESDGSGSGFLLTSDGTFTAISGPAPGGDANGINSRGQIVGSYSVSGVRYGFLLSRGEYTGMIVFPGAIVTNPFGITDDGQHIIGAYWQSGVRHGFVLSRKPLK